MRKPMRPATVAEAMKFTAPIRENDSDFIK